MVSAAPKFPDLPTRPIIEVLSPIFQAPPGVTADLLHAHTRVDRAVRGRRTSDIHLINYWLYLLVVSWATLGIYGIVLFVKRINRIDRFGTRKAAYYEGLIDWTDRYAQLRGSDGNLHHLLTELRAQVRAAYAGELRRIAAGPSAVLTILTLGIFGLYVRCRENRYWWAAQVLEQEFDDRLSVAWSGLGLTRYPITFRPAEPKCRSFRLQLFLTIVTCGLWGIVWSYRIHTDPERLYPEFHAIEDALLLVVRSH